MQSIVQAAPEECGKSKDHHKPQRKEWASRGDCFPVGALVCHLLQHLLGGGQFLPMFLQRTFQVFDLLSLCFYLVGQDAHLKGDIGLTSAEGEHETMVQKEI